MPPGEPVTRLPKGLHHIISTRPNKFAGKLPSRLPHGPTKYVQPRDRVRKWNIRPGDKVRLLIGAPTLKFINKQNSSEGWTVFNVKQIDMERGRVYLEGVNNIKGNVIHRPPENFDTLTESQKNSYNEQQNFVKTMRPVHYSNVQLCLEDKQGPDSVFASRIATSSTHFSKESQRLDWRRFAAKISGGTEVTESVDGEGDVEAQKRVQIPWPKPAKPYEHPKPDTPHDTDNETAQGTTLSLYSVKRVTDTRASDLIPQHINAPPPTDQAFTDTYLAQLSPTEREKFKQEEIDLIDMVMPLYLSEELAPRFAKLKKYKAYKTRREVEDIEKQALANEAVRSWEAHGRDKGLKQVMDLESVGLEGVFIKPRTRKEIRESSIDEFNLANEEVRREVNLNVREGRVWDEQVGDWTDGEKSLNIQRKRERRERKDRRIHEKLQQLTLENEA